MTAYYRIPKLAFMFVPSPEISQPPVLPLSSPDDALPLYQPHSGAGPLLCCTRHPVFPCHGTAWLAKLMYWCSALPPSAFPGSISPHYFLCFGSTVATQQLYFWYWRRTGFSVEYRHSLQYCTVGCFIYLLGNFSVINGVKLSEMIAFYKISISISNKH